MCDGLSQDDPFDESARGPEEAEEERRAVGSMSRGELRFEPHLHQRWQRRSVWRSRLAAAALPLGPLPAQASQKARTRKEREDAKKQCNLSQENTPLLVATALRCATRCVAARPLRLPLLRT